MNDFPLPSGTHLERLRRTFAEIDGAEALLQAEDPRPAKLRVAASALYAAAQATAPNRAAELVLSESRAARRLFRQSIVDTAAYALPEAKAASSGGPPARHGEGCRIRIERSRAEPDQFFVVVELIRQGAAGTAPTSLIVCDSEDRCRRFPLPALRDGIAQFIAEADSDLMRLIGDPSTRVYLQ
jgi:hypothetical protein